MAHIRVEQLHLNEIGYCRVRLSRPVVFDSYERSRATGGFIVIDRVTHGTVAADSSPRARRRRKTAAPKTWCGRNRPFPGTSAPTSAAETLHPLAHGAERIGQIHRGGRPGTAALRHGAPYLPAGRRQHTPRAEPGPGVRESDRAESGESAKSAGSSWMPGSSS